MGKWWRRNASAIERNSRESTDVFKELLSTYQEAKTAKKNQKMAAKVVERSEMDFSDVLRRFITSSLFRKGVPILCILLSFLWWLNTVKRKKRNEQIIKFENEKVNEVSYYDVMVIGGGPAGCTSSFYLAKGGLRVLQVERNAYPFDKVCGDIIVSTGHDILQEMGVMQDFIVGGIGRWLTTRGLVSPSGNSFIADLKDENHDFSVQRILLDEKMSNAAQRAGTELQQLSVESLESPSVHDGYWKVSCKNEKNEATEVHARVIVAADGPNSYISRQIGLISTPPNTQWSRCFVKPGSHCFKADFVIFHPPEIAPGFFIISKEVEDYLSVCCFIIPGGAVCSEDLPSIHRELVTENDQIRGALGPHAEFTELQIIPFRVGGVNKCYADQFLVVGGAAGHVDPLNGQGIQYALLGGKIAAKTILNGFRNGDISEQSLQGFQSRVNGSFGYDLWMSGFLGKIMYYFPSVLDATAAMIKRNGEGPLSLWLAARSGKGSKFQFIRPDIIVMISVEFIYQIVMRKIKLSGA